MTTTTTPEPQPGQRVLFRARDFSSSAEGTPAEMTGTVIRPVWGRARNVSIRTDDGKVYVRLASAVRLRPAVVHPAATTPQWIRDLWRGRGLCQQCGQHPYATEWAGNGWLVCQPCGQARQEATS